MPRATTVAKARASSTPVRAAAPTWDGHRDTLLTALDAMFDANAAWATEAQRNPGAGTADYLEGIERLSERDGTFRAHLTSPPPSRPALRRRLSSVKTYLDETDGLHDGARKAGSGVHDKHIKAHASTRQRVKDLVSLLLAEWDEDEDEDESVTPVLPDQTTKKTPPAKAGLVPFAPPVLIAKLPAAHGTMVHELLAGRHVSGTTQERAALQSNLASAIQELLKEYTQASGETAQMNIVALRKLQRDVRDRMDRQFTVRPG